MSFIELGPNQLLVAEPKEVSWDKKTLKRVIPNHLMPRRKLGFHAKKETKKALPAPGDFSALTFDAKAFETPSFDDDLPLYSNSKDVPPPRSLYDLDKVELPQPEKAEFLNKDPHNFTSVFSREPEAKPQEEKAPLAHSESAVLVFGYPEHMANQVIAYFSEFGRVLEKFEVVQPKAMLATTGAFPVEEKTGATPPIFSGKSWVKLTYDNPALAVDALQESGNVFNGALIGVVPYSRATVEKLQKRKLSGSEDVGGFHVAPERAKSDSAEEKTYIKRYDMKDGLELFLKAPPQSDTKGELRGVLGAVANYLFGFGEL